MNRKKNFDIIIIDYVDIDYKPLIDSHGSEIDNVAKNYRIRRIHLHLMYIPIHIYEGIHGWHVVGLPYVPDIQWNPFYYSFAVFEERIS